MTVATDADATADAWSTIEPEASRRLLQCAVEAFAEQGYHATTTRDIAGRAGLSPAAVYVHYPSKAALLATISRVGHEAALALVEDAAGVHSGQDPDPRARLRAVVARLTAWHARHHRVARVVQYELTALLPQEKAAISAMRRRVEQLVEDVISDGVRTGLMHTKATGSARSVARAILSLTIDVARWYDPAGRDTPDDLGRLYADLAARMVGASDEAVATAKAAGE